MTYGKWRGRNIENGARFRVSFCFVFFVASKCGLGRLELSSFIPSDGVCGWFRVSYLPRGHGEMSLWMGNGIALLFIFKFAACSLGGGLDMEIDVRIGFL